MFLLNKNFDRRGVIWWNTDSVTGIELMEDIQTSKLVNKWEITYFYEILDVSYLCKNLSDLITTWENGKSQSNEEQCAWWRSLEVQLLHYKFLFCDRPIWHSNIQKFLLIIFLSTEH
jgi:hypothetical protein